MATIIDGMSRTFNEFLLIPGLTSKDCTFGNVDLSTGITKFNEKTKETVLQLKIPMVSAAMQSVSDAKLAIELAKRGGLSFIYCSQSIEEQCDMIKKVKAYKAGFVKSDSNLLPTSSIDDLLTLINQNGHTTIVVTDNGNSDGRLLGLITKKNVRLSRLKSCDLVSKIMTPVEELVTAQVGIDLSTANDIIWENKINCLPIVDKEGHLCYLIFRKDYDNSKKFKDQLVDKHKRLMVGAAISTWDYKERVPALISAGVDILCVDSSDGYSEYQAEAIKWVKENYGETIKIGGGNIVHPKAFIYLVNAGADFIKIGIGGGSICTTREQKGIGRGQASAILDVAQERDSYFNEYGTYIPLCADGGIVHDYHVALALAMGADFVMLGRYFARFDESPGKKTQIGNKIVKEHWGEGTARSANWQRYTDNDKPTIVFEEGVDSFVPYAGSMEENIIRTLAKIKATMVSCGSTTIADFQKNSVLTIVSQSSIVEGGAHDLISRPTVE